MRWSTSVFRQRLADLASGVSLLTSLAIGAVATRSYWTADYFSYEDQDYRIGYIASERGVLRAGRERPFCLAYQHGPFNVWTHHVSDATASMSWAAMLPAANGKTGDWDIGGWGIRLPYWLPVIVFALPLVVRLRRRTIAGHCSCCDYDLRATPGRCPECGGIPGAQERGTGTGAQERGHH